MINLLLRPLNVTQPLFDVSFLLYRFMPFIEANYLFFLSKFFSDKFKPSLGTISFFFQISIDKAYFEVYTNSAILYCDSEKFDSDRFHQIKYEN